MKKRFIAGAICPSCKALDKVALILDSEPETMICVACGYQEQRPTEEELRAASQEELQSTEWQSVKFPEGK